MIEIKAKGNRKKYDRYPRTKIANKGGDRKADKIVMTDWYNGYRYDYPKVRRLLHSNIGRPYNNILSELKSRLGKSVVRITPIEILRNNVYKSKEEVSDRWGGFYWSNNILNYKTPKKEAWRSNYSSLWKTCYTYNNEHLPNNKELYALTRKANNDGLATVGQLYVRYMGHTYFTTVYLARVNTFSSYLYKRVHIIGEHESFGIDVSSYQSPDSYKWIYDVRWYNDWFSKMPPYIFIAKKLSDKQLIC